MTLIMPGPATETMDGQKQSTGVARRLELPSTGSGRGKRLRRIRSNTGTLFLMHTSRGKVMGLSQTFLYLSYLPCHSVLALSIAT